MANSRRIDGGKTVAVNRSERGYVRLEVLESDRPLLREVARKLRDESAQSNQLRSRLQSLVGGRPKLGRKAVLAGAPLDLDGVDLTREETSDVRLTCDLPRRQLRLPALQA
jgi:hypothetical protein